MTPQQRMDFLVMVAKTETTGNRVKHYMELLEYVEALENNAHTRGLNDYAAMLRDANTKSATNQDKDA